ncbi:hypothetical protein DO71_4601 [Burkholderia pseudomallei]|nr:hypothetical protein DO71_4601 [Burkholderia pseudomallei]KGW26284.1 hypothetical protein Y047_2399 [Burkholderia pseudomallei MSHR3016]
MTGDPGRGGWSIFLASHRGKPPVPFAFINVDKKGKKWLNAGGNPPHRS